MLRPPQPKPMTRTEQGALLILKSEVTIHDYKSSGTILDIPSLDASIRAGQCRAVGPSCLCVCITNSHTHSSGVSMMQG